MLKIIRSGIYTTVQDSGRGGFRRLGISQGGALDLPALSMANMLVGNEAGPLVWKLHWANLPPSLPNRAGLR